MRNDPLRDRHYNRPDIDDARLEVNLSNAISLDSAWRNIMQMPPGPGRDAYLSHLTAPFEALSATLARLYDVEKELKQTTSHLWSERCDNAQLRRTISGPRGESLTTGPAIIHTKIDRCDWGVGIHLAPEVRQALRAGNDDAWTMIRNALTDALNAKPIT
jgi:hypothetical protein